MLVPALTPGGPSKGQGLLCVVSGSKVALRPEDPPPGVGDVLFVGTLDGAHCWAVDATDGPPAALEVDPGEYVDLMSLYGRVDETTWLAAGRAVQLVDWDRSHRFCGRCATPTVLSEGERARRCPACGLQAFPRLAPAIIVLVEREDGRALLARNGRWPTKMFSCLAGFVEPGESVEAAVIREVGEEVGVVAGNLRYFGSQPWPFPHSLMLGFHADWVSGDIAADGVEIAEARWFSADDLPQIPGPISIARRLIDDWVGRMRSPSA